MVAAYAPSVARAISVGARLAWFLTALWLCWSSTEAAGQSIWIQPEPTQGIRAELLFPATSGTRFSFPSSALFLTGSILLRSNVAVAVELPVALGRGNLQRGVGLLQEEFQRVNVGNAMLAVLWTDSTANHSFMMAGLRIPTGDPGHGADLGEMADYSRPVAFGADTWSLHVLGGRPLWEGKAVWLEPSVGGALSRSHGVYGLYNLLIRSQPNRVQFSAGLVGRYQPGQGGDASYRTNHSLGAMIGTDVRGMRVGGHVQAPVGDPEIRDWLLGIVVERPFR
ncbi:MAG: hypothetical protein WEA24_18290 [Gemmatimonadota bacterium]